MIQSIERAIRILEVFKNKEVMGVSEIAKELEMSKTTVHSIIRTLAHYGYLEKDKKTNKYMLGFALLELGELYSNRLDLRRIAMEHMENLQKETGEAVQLAIYKQEHMIYLARSLTKKFMQISMKEGQVTPTYCTATGKAILAHLQEEQLEKYLDFVKYERRTPNTIVSKLELLKELKITYERGYSIDNEENEVGIKGIGMPIFNSEGQPIAALSIGCMVENMSPKYIEILVPKLKNAVDSISSQLGYQGNKII